MNRTELEILLQINNYKKGGTKEASIKISEFLKSAEKELSNFQPKNSCISTEEFISCIKTLIGYAHDTPDTVVKTWYCNSNCFFASYTKCPGKYNVNENSTELCPHFVDKTL